MVKSCNINPINPVDYQVYLITIPPYPDARKATLRLPNLMLRQQLGGFLRLQKGVGLGGKKHRSMSDGEEDSFLDNP